MIKEIVKKIAYTCEQDEVQEPNIYTEFGKFTVGESGAVIFSVLAQKLQGRGQIGCFIFSIPEASSPWSAWGPFDECDKENMWGPWSKKRKRTCSSSCVNGASQLKNYDCRNTCKCFNFVQVDD